MIGISPIAGPTPACKLCETKSTDPNFLLFVQFGTALSPSKRQRIEQYINDVIYPQHQPSSRKRGRHDYDYESEYSDYSSSYDRRKRQRTANGYRQSAQSSDSPTLVIYDPEAGFSLDTTTDTLDAPLDYKHGVTAILGADATGLGNPCFNCSIPGHEMRDCPWPLDHDKIEANRLEFKDKRGVGPFDSRLYLVVEEEKRRDEMRQKFRPGQMSEELREALGLREGEVAPFVKSMRYAGYPPAYLGSSEGQDPMEARPRDVPPPTPLLKIYDSIEELVNEPAQKTKTIAAAAAADDGEDGAISDDEEGAITDDDDDEGAIDEALRSHRGIFL
ncbi:Zinc finger CCHC domain-containing protein 8 [Linderina macrospora]|uniref:Zinc finger CCHC domain-containing protein 8 n=1 Tax=Linderina macrospora TaxID=4868 RepID=A0ACC1JC06_9FUNG|nr:Zinc finger CCHC domain-containing protein 8 [Linderina macrospora]